MAAEQDQDVVTIGTWLRFIVGSREAILCVARSRQALRLGLVFVLSAGFAREYDGADLWHEPWHLVLPLVASLATSLILWAVVYLASTNHRVENLKFWQGYRTLLTFYWMTAPLAWIYAIPVERFLPPGDATAANFWFLGLVSVWRVVLITRCLSVWLSANYFAMFFLVMLFADSVAILLSFASPMPIFNVMGGVRHSAADLVVLSVILGTQIYGVLTWLVWLIGSAIVIGMKSPWSVPEDAAEYTRVSRPLWALSALLVLSGTLLLRVGQGEQRHAYEATRLLKSNQVEAAVEYMSQYPRDEFPTIWDPPPRIGYGELSPAVVDVIAAIRTHNAPAWVRELYVGKLTQDPRSLFDQVWPVDDDGDAKRFVGLLEIFEELVPAASLDRQQWEDLHMVMERGQLDQNRQRFRDYLFKDRKSSNTHDEPEVSDKTGE